MAYWATGKRPSSWRINPEFQLFFNPSKGFVRDFVQSFAQKFGLGTDRMAKEFALSLGRAGRAMKITAHSQGTLTVANAAMLHGLPPGSTYHFKRPRR